MSLTLTVKKDLAPLQAPLRRLLRLGEHPQPLLLSLAMAGESSTRARFAGEVDPDGEPWEESLRKQLFGGKTLTKDGHLGDSITADADDHSARWGSNRIYAAIHQFGGVIKAKTSKGLAFQLASGESVVTPFVVMPARPFLGINSDDRADMLDVVHEHLRRVLDAKGGAQ